MGLDGTENAGVQVAQLVVRSRPNLVIFVPPPASLKDRDSWLQHFKGAKGSPPIILVVEKGEPDELFAWLAGGVSDFITPPLTALDLLPRIRRLLEPVREGSTLAERLKKTLGLKQMIGESQVFRNIINKLPLVAQCDAGVLITGETGTGKEFCARAIHYLSARARRPFVPVNCGAIPVELVENELFGHERGAFTGASHARMGLISEAEGGTLLLDEVDCLPLLSQVKLLRFLQEKEYRPLGATRLRPADVRLIAAANTDLEASVRAGRLRQDLYYRLNIIPLRLPALRERREDISLLTQHFLSKYAIEFHKPPLKLSPDALQKLRRYAWPGNVRELENLIASLVAMAEHDLIEADDFHLAGVDAQRSVNSFREAKCQFERAYIEDLMLTHHGNITKAAQAAHKNRRAFWELIRKHQIDVSRFKTNTAV
jgi:DNA-binding NtrC family response regulator